MLKVFIKFLLSAIYLISTLIYFFPHLAGSLTIPTFTIFLISGILLMAVLIWGNNGTIAIIVLAGVLIVTIDHLEILIPPDWAKGFVLLFGLILTILGILEVIDTALKGNK